MPPTGLDEVVLSVTSSGVVDLPTEPAGSVRVITAGDLAPLGEGQAALEAGEYALAAEKFTGVIDLLPFYPMVRLKRAEAWLGAGEPARALADVDAAIRQDSQVASKDDASAALAALFRLGDDLALAHTLRAGALAELGDLRAALAAVDDALRLAPQSPTLRDARAALVDRLGSAVDARTAPAASDTGPAVGAAPRPGSREAR